MICPICKTVFTTKNRKRKYCSDECYKEANRRRTSVENKTRDRFRTKQPKKHICRWCNKTEVEGKYERCYICNELLSDFLSLEGNEVY